MDIYFVTQRLNKFCVCGVNVYSCIFVFVGSYSLTFALFRSSECPHIWVLSQSSQWSQECNWRKSPTRGINRDRRYTREQKRTETHAEVVVVEVVEAGKQVLSVVGWLVGWWRSVGWLLVFYFGGWWWGWMYIWRTIRNKQMKHILNRFWMTHT